MLDSPRLIQYIASNMHFVLDTNILVAAVRSPSGASAEILRQAIKGKLGVLCSVPLFLEYESVLLRPEQLSAANVNATEVGNLLNVLAGFVKRVDIQFLWRPQLRDANDDMVLELAVNGLGLGKPVTIITTNNKDFAPQAASFGITVLTPRQFFQGV
jgi:putative PIN family toxin of toxin-antitoxin system